MQSHGLFTGGAIVVSCTGYLCPEYGIQRKYQVAAVDLASVSADDMVPLEVQPEKPVAENPAVDVLVEDPPVIQAPEMPVGTEPPLADPATEIPVELPA